MVKINQMPPDVEIKRQEKNLTDAQKRNAELTKEGVVVNSLIKAPADINELYDSMVISDNVKLPEKIYQNKEVRDKNLTPISLVAIGVMAGMTLITALIKHSAKVNLSLDQAKRLPSMTRNLAVNDEKHQAIYQMVQCANQKTILAGIGVFTISTMAFMAKMFTDGFKDVWVKRREADIQKNLQEKLIAVETQSFSGKMQIMRSMLAQKANEFSEYLCPEPQRRAVFRNFGNGTNQINQVKFEGSDNKPKEKSDTNSFFATGLLTLVAIVGLGFFSMKNLRTSKKYLEDYVMVAKGKIEKIVEESKGEDDTNIKDILKSMLQSIDADAQYINDTLSKLKWTNTKEKERFINDVIFSTNKSTAQVAKALGGDGTPKPAFYSHVNDYRAFFYNWLLDTSNPLFRNLFFGITGITGLSYGGKVIGEAVKDVQVKKMNAQTELDLQQRLVSTELRNFKTKKDSVIEPLCDEFYLQLERGKPKDELKTIAENILYEVKNGPPFIYS